MTEKDQSHETDSDASTAYRLFLQASIACPSSVTAQGAHIAAHHKGSNFDQLGRSLLANNNLFTRIMQIAKTVHTHKKVRPPVTREGTRKIIETDFMIAGMFRKAELNPDELKDIYQTYYQASNQPEFQAQGVTRENIVRRWMLQRFHQRPGIGNPQ